MHRTPRLKGIVGVFSHKQGFLHHLEKGGGILQLNRQIMKVPGSEGVNREEFLIDIFQIEDEVFLCTPLKVEEPTSFQEAVDCPNHKEWMNSMKDEIDSMTTKKVWELVDLPPKRKFIGNEWVFKIKSQANGSIDKSKAHLVAKSFTQIEDIDYKEIFSHVVRFAFIHLLLALVAHLDIELYQMDVKNAFLNRNLEEEMYMNKPIGLYRTVKNTKCVVLKDPYMVSSNLLDRGTLDSMKQSLCLTLLWFQKTIVCMSRKQQRRLYSFPYMLMTYSSLGTTWK